MGIKIGGAAIEQRQKEDAASQATYDITHPIQNMWSLGLKEDGDSAIVRILSENVFSFPMHTFVTDIHDKKTEYACTKELDPEIFGEGLRRPCWVCDNVTKKYTKKDGSTFIAAAKPSNRVFVPVLVREFNEDGDVVDHLKEYELTDPKNPEGEKIKKELPEIAIFTQGTRFEQALLNKWKKTDRSTKNPKYTFVDRDWEITRTGKTMQDTAYTPDFLTSFKDPDMNTVEQLWEYLDIPGRENYDPSNPLTDPVFKAVTEWIARRGSVAWEKKHFTGEEDSDGNNQSQPDVEAEGYEAPPASNARAQQPTGLTERLQNQLNKGKKNDE